MRTGVLLLFLLLATAGCGGGEPTSGPDGERDPATTAPAATSTTPTEPARTTESPAPPTTTAPTQTTVVQQSTTTVVYASSTTTVAPASSTTATPTTVISPSTTVPPAVDDAETGPPPTPIDRAEGEPLRIVLTGDSITVQVDPHLRAVFGSEAVNKPRRHGGTALCDWFAARDEELGIENLAWWRPHVIVVDHGGNAMTPCMADDDGRPLEGEAYLAKYLADSDYLVEVARRTGTRVLFVDQPVGRGGALSRTLNIFPSMPERHPGGMVRYVSTWPALSPEGNFVQSARCADEEPGCVGGWGELRSPPPYGHLEDLGAWRYAQVIAGAFVEAGWITADAVGPGAPDLPLPVGFPRICQPWNGVQNRPDLTELERIALHDLWWTGTGSLGLVWDTSDDQPHVGLATELRPPDGGERFDEALDRRQALLELNPGLVTLAEVRYRDAPYVDDPEGRPWWDRGYYPADSPFWLRDADGNPVPGWGEDADGDGRIEADEILGSLTDFGNPDLIELVARKVHALEHSGVVDGVFLDWWNEDHQTSASFLDWSAFHMSAEEEVQGRLAILRRIRELVGDDFLILVNTNDRTAPRSAPYVNGTFMEVWKPDWSTGYTVDRLLTVEDTLSWASGELLEPRINCLEGWRVVDDYGNEAAQVDERNSEENRRWMRLFTTLALTHSDGSVVFGDDNAEPTRDHHHNWYDFWDADLGQPVGVKRTIHDGVEGLFIRRFTNGFAVYNRSGAEQEVRLPGSYVAVSTGQVGEVHTVGDMDGEILLG